MMIGDGLLCVVACVHGVSMGATSPPKKGSRAKSRTSGHCGPINALLAAQDAGLFDREIAPVEIAASGVTTIVDEDEAPAGTRAPKRCSLEPAFDQAAR